MSKLKSWYYCYDKTYNLYFLLHMHPTYAGIIMLKIVATAVNIYVVIHVILQHNVPPNIEYSCYWTYWSYSPINPIVIIPNILICVILSVILSPK